MTSHRDLAAHRRSQTADSHWARCVGPRGAGDNAVLVGEAGGRRDRCVGRGRLTQRSRPAHGRTSYRHVGPVTEERARHLAVGAGPGGGHKLMYTVRWWRVGRSRYLVSIVHASQMQRSPMDALTATAAWWQHRRLPRWQHRLGEPWRRQRVKTVANNTSRRLGGSGVGAGP